MRFIITLLLFSAFTTVLMAQQDAHFSHYMFNRVTINPGSAGSEGKINTTIIRRDQWVGIDFRGDMEGTPKTTLASIDGDIELNKKSPLNKHTIGVSLSIVNDVLGFFSDYYIKTGVAYQKKFKNGLLADGTLGIGLELGVVNKALSGANWVFPEVNESTVPTEASGFGMDIGFGAYYTTKKMYLGLSSTHLPQFDVKMPIKNSSSGDLFNVDMKRHFFITGGYEMETLIPLVELYPSVFIQTDMSVFSYSIGANLVYNKRFWGGANYRMGDAIILMAGVELKNGIKFGYAYDITTTNLARGSHEIMLNYSFDLEIVKTPQKYKSVRFL